MYQKQSGLILGFHGCDIKTQQKIINTNQNVMIPSQKEYDWLGHGIYFWQNSPHRALEFAKESKKRKDSNIRTPAVVGAVLDLGNCLDLLDSENLQLVKGAYEEIKEIFKNADKELPKNIAPKGSVKNDLLLRPLDCIVIEHLLKKTDFDSIRGLFPEGKELYAGAGFREKDHIQICIRDVNCIKGYFLPRKEV